ncbi:General negative regulator of transcription subunit 4 [Hanseniaspora osmophila]|uniref:General negative regulator of transcription subunit 4 n=1 Tax=Hanseniaspora osmophila TaxID=56408 RepID=A0A1E5RB05_9ASCO|nr:General negative regulator of transcription subunit 4 [Hanseniaspora osmophila]
MATAYIEPFLSEDEDEYCPLCVEPMDLSDKHFKPCPCGYQICSFCYNNIRQNPELNGKCPACRRKYDDESVQYVVLSPEELKLEQLKQAKKEKERKIRDKERKENENANRRQLANMRVIQKNLVYVVGLNPSCPYEEVAGLLKSDKYFGQYGRITKIVVNRKENGSNQGYGVYVTFSKKEEAYRCISQVDGTYWDGRIIKAAYGTTKYCSSYLRGQSCPNPNCMFLHEPGEEAEYYNRHGVQNGRPGYNSTTHHSALPKTVPPLKLSAPSNAADTEHVLNSDSSHVYSSASAMSPNLASHYAHTVAQPSQTGSGSTGAASHTTYTNASPSANHIHLNTSNITSASASQLTPAGIPVSNPWGSVKPSQQPTVNPWGARASGTNANSAGGSSAFSSTVGIGSAGVFPSLNQASNAQTPSTSSSLSSSTIDATNKNNLNTLNNLNSPHLSGSSFNALNQSQDHLSSNGKSAFGSNTPSSISSIIGTQNSFNTMPAQHTSIMKSVLKKNGGSSTAMASNSSNKNDKDKEKENNNNQTNIYDPCANAVKLLDDAIDYLSTFKSSSISLRTSIFRNENEQLRYQSMPPLFSYENITPVEKSEGVLRQKLIKMLSVEPTEPDANMSPSASIVHSTNAIEIPSVNASPENPMVSPMANTMFQSPHMFPDQQLAQQQLLQQQQLAQQQLAQQQQALQQQLLLQQQQQQHFAHPPGMFNQKSVQSTPQMAAQSMNLNPSGSSNSTDLLNQLIKGKKI